MHYVRSVHTAAQCTHLSKERSGDMVLLVWISRVKCHRTVKRCRASSRTPCAEIRSGLNFSTINFPFMLTEVGRPVLGLHLFKNHQKIFWEKTSLAPFSYLVFVQKCLADNVFADGRGRGQRVQPVEELHTRNVQLPSFCVQLAPQNLGNSLNSDKKNWNYHSNT